MIMIFDKSFKSKISCTEIYIILTLYLTTAWCKTEG